MFAGLASRYQSLTCVSIIACSAFAAIAAAEESPADTRDGNPTSRQLYELKPLTAYLNPPDAPTRSVTGETIRGNNPGQIRQVNGASIELNPRGFTVGGRNKPQSPVPADNVLPFKPQSPPADKKFGFTPINESPPSPAATTKPLPHADTGSGSENNPAGDAANPIVSMAREVQQRLQQVEASTEIADEAKADLIQRYRQTLDTLKLAADATTKARTYQAEIKGAPEQIAELKEQTETPIQNPEIKPPVDTPLPQLEQMLTLAESELAEATQQFEKVVADAKARQERKAKLPQLSEAATKQLSEVTAALAAAVPEGESPALSQAKRAELEARRRLLESQIPLQKVEVLWGEALTDAFTLRRDLAQRKQSAAEKRAAGLRTLVTQSRKQEATRKAREARRELAEAHPALKELAQANADLAEQRVQLSQSIEQTAAKLKRVTGRLAHLEEQYEEIAAKEEKAGLTTAVGMVLRRQRDELPRLDPLYKRLSTLEVEIPHREIELMSLQTERDKMAEFDALYESICKSLALTSPSANDGDLQETARELLESKRTYLDDLLKDYDTYLGRLTDLDTNTRQLIAKTEEFESYIDERVLWVRSTEVLAAKDAGRAWNAILYFFDSGHWSGLLSGLGQMAKTRPVETSLAGLICLVVLVYGHRIRRSLRELGETDSADEAGSFLPTAKALVLTVIGASLWPLLIEFLAWRLTALDEATQFTRAVATALHTTAIVFWTFTVVRHVCRSQGVAEVHFHWSPSAVRMLRRNLTWLMLLWVPITFLVVLIDAHRVDDWSNSLGRILFVTGMVALSIFCARILRPGSGVFEKLTRSQSDGWLQRLRWLWYALSVGTPAAVACLAAWGYYYTAEQLAGRLLATIWLAVGLVVAEALVSRWLVLLRDQLHRHQEAQQAAQVAESNVAGEESAHRQATIFADFDITSISREIHRLTHGGVFVGLLLGAWLIWANVLPALGILDRVELWNNTVQVTQQVETTDGTQVAQTVDKVVPTTLAHLLMSLGLVWGTIFAARNLPGLIEVVLLQRLPLDQGGRHAVTTICRYVLTLVGIALSCRLIGITWASVQWLVAAMTVGLGFGLQEIFANFVSGLILLIERPLRVGDLVTVGSVTGTVSKMHIRATTVADFDRRELVVPNKKFITDEFVNWTLSDPITRVVLPVGIAYGSETNRAHELLLKVADEHPLVLADPEPTAMFSGFGDSTLDFQLRVFIPTRDTYPIVVHELNMAIDREFAKAEIEIAFPQRDINVRSVEGLAQMLPVIGRQNPSENKAA